jgi:hypothetical protein
MVDDDATLNAVEETEMVDDDDDDDGIADEEIKKR